MSQEETNLKIFRELFDGVTSLEELSRRLEQPAERELAKRAAVLRNFDGTVFDRFLAKDLPGDYAITFDEFVKSIKVEPVPRTLNSFRIKDDARQHYIEDLLSDRKAGGETNLAKERIFQSVLEYYATKGAEFDLDRLALLAIVSPEMAKEELERLYAEADERFDLPRCDDLLRTLEVRSRLLGDDLVTFCRSKRQYYNSRNLFITDYYQTNTYLGRGNMAEDFARLVAAPSEQGQKWIFHVYATGGLGKTMFVRWLISRHCVPERRRIPVARLDFDLLDLNYVSRYPLLLLLPIADQLNQQIDQRPFTEPFSSMWQFRPLLDTPTSADIAKRFDLESNFQSVEPSWAVTALKVFSRTLKEAKFDKPIVIAIDTLEEMLLVNRDSLVKVIQQIEEIHKSYPALRLVLSGRYDLRDQLNELNELFDKETVQCELKRFNTAEARVYLTANRGLKDESFIEAIIEKCADDKAKTINPFILSLMTDLVSSRDIESVEEIRKYPRAEVAYMIQRIIERIKDPDVRWMLRYAVVPRILTLDVVENVMWGHLLEERAERGKDLKVKSDNESFNQRDYWSYGEAATAKDAWEKLRPLVSSYGWVSFDPNDVSRLRLHSEVVVPMRFLLATEEIFALLHKEAAQYFVKKANEQSAKWAFWMSEAVYHHFQMEGPKAANFWRQQLGAKQVKTDMEGRRQLAFEITRRDYVDGNETPLKWPNEESETAIVSCGDLCEAHHEVAVTSIVLAAKNKQKTERYAAEWDKARQHLVKLDALLKGDTERSFKPSFDVEIYVRLASQLNKSLIDYDVVIPLMESALLSTKGIFLPLGLKIQLAEMYESINSNRAEQYFREAHKESGFLGIPYLSPSRIQLKLARWYQDQKRFRDALAEYQNALADAERRKATATARNIKYRLAEVNREIGLYSTAESLSRELHEPSRPTAAKAEEKFDYALLFNSIQARDLYRPLTPLKAYEAPLETADHPRKQAAIAEVRGFALGQLMEFNDAASILEQAKELWSRVSDPFGPDRTRMQRVELHLNQVGNVNETAALLDSWETHSERKDPEVTTQMELLRVRCLCLQELAGADEKWRSLLERKEVTSSPRSVVRVLTTGLALGLGSDETPSLLLKALREIEPSSARLSLLAGFRFAEHTGESDLVPEYNKLIKLIEWPVEKKEAFSSTVMFADLLRFCRSDPRDLLERAVSRSLQQGELFAYIQLLSASNRAGIRSAAEDDLSGFLREFGQYRALCFAVLLERAQRELDHEDLDACEKTLTEAREKYSQTDVTTKWSAFSRELAGRLDQRRGDQEKAVLHLIAAVSIYAQLGDKRSIRRVRELLPGAREVAPSEPPHLGQPNGIFSMLLETTDYGITVTSGIVAAGEEQSLKLSHNAVAHPFPKSEFSNQLTAPLRDGAAIFELTDRITKDFDGFRRELGRLLVLPREVYSRMGLGRESGSLFDARLELPITVAKIPVELALVEGDAGLTSLFRYFYRSTSNDLGQRELIKWIQIATNVLTGHNLVIDGLIGSGTVGLLTGLGIAVATMTMDKVRERLEDRLRKRTGNSRVKALIISPSFETQIKAQRGHDVGAGALKYLYEDLDFNFMTIDVRRPERLADEMAKAIATFGPQLVHIESSFTENPSTGQVYLDFNVAGNVYGVDKVDYASKPASDYLQLSTTLLNDALYRSSASRLRPLLILEAQSAPGDSASVKQMLLRNTFAAELSRLGGTSGVIAIGLFPDVNHRTPMLRLLADGLSTGEYLGKAVSRMNQRSFEIAGKGIDLIQSPVLFTDNPLFTLLPMD